MGQNELQTGLSPRGKVMCFVGTGEFNPDSVALAAIVRPIILRARRPLPSSTPRSMIRPTLREQLGSTSPIAIPNLSRHAVASHDSRALAERPQTGCRHPFGPFSLAWLFEGRRRTSSRCLANLRRCVQDWW